MNASTSKLNPGSKDKFTWGEDDLIVYSSEAEFRAAQLDEEIARVDALLREAGVDPNDPEAALGDLDADDE